MHGPTLTAEMKLKAFQEWCVWEGAKKVSVFSSYLTLFPLCSISVFSVFSGRKN